MGEPRSRSRQDPRGSDGLWSERIPAGPGTYILILGLHRSRRLAIGRLGTFTFPRGHYLYVGSARGPGGLKARLRHHLRGAARPRWHIDYLRRMARPVAVWWVTGTLRLESRWAEALGRAAGLQPAVPGFGSSDSASETHLFFSPSFPPPPRHAVGFLAG